MSFLTQKFESDSDSDDEDFVGGDDHDEDDYDSEGKLVKKSNKRKASGSGARFAPAPGAARGGAKRARGGARKAGDRVGAAVVSDSEDDILDENQAQRCDELNGDHDGRSMLQSESAALGQKSAAVQRDDSGVERAALAAKTDSLWASLRETDAPRATASATALKPAALAVGLSASFASSSSVASSSPSPAAVSTNKSSAAASAEPTSGFTARGKPKLDFTKRTKSTAEIEREKQMVVHKEIEFAGERVSVATTLDKDSAEAKKIVAQGKPSGLDTVLSQWTQLKQMTTFDKSKVDWERDKAAVGDEHELAQARKNGFLEKAQFLKQVDQNQYERERDERLRLAAARHRSAAQ